MSLNDFGSTRTTSLTHLTDEFTIIKVDISTKYNGANSYREAIITTKENFSLYGNEYNKFFSSDIFIVGKLDDPKLNKAINNGTFKSKIKCVQSPNGRNYILIDA